MVLTIVNVIRLLLLSIHLFIGVCFMTITCPKCRSIHIRAKNTAKRTGSSIGTVAGATAGAAGMLSGAELGAATGLLAGPVGAFAGGLAGAILGALFGGALGCKLGANLGEIIDTNILDNYCCLSCGHSFSVTPVAEYDFESVSSRPPFRPAPATGFAHHQGQFEDDEL
jgi:hypothetical protein